MLCGRKCLTSVVTTFSLHRSTAKKFFTWSALHCGIRRIWESQRHTPSRRKWRLPLPSSVAVPCVAAGARAIYGTFMGKIRYKRVGASLYECTCLFPVPCRPGGVWRVLRWRSLSRRRGHVDLRQSAGSTVAGKVPLHPDPGVARSCPPFLGALERRRIGIVRQ